MTIEYRGNGIRLRKKQNAFRPGRGTIPHNHILSLQSLSLKASATRTYQYQPRLYSSNLKERLIPWIRVTCKKS